MVPWALRSPASSPPPRSKRWPGNSKVQAGKVPGKAKAAEARAEGKAPGEGSGTGQGGGSQGSGGSGAGGQGAGSTGQGAGGAGGGVTLVLNTLSPNTSAPAPSAHVGTATQKATRVRILSHHVKGAKATIVVQVPAAGKVTLTGHSVRTVGGQATRAGRLNLKVRLSTAGIAAMRRGHRHLTVRLTASFKPTRGARSSATTAVTFT